MESIVTLTMNPAVDTSSVVPQVFPDHKLRCGSPRHDAGGGGINVARAIRKLGGEALAIHVAGGPTGELLQNLLDSEKVRQESIPAKAWTRENFYVFEECSRHTYRFLMPGEPLKEQEWQRCLKRVSRLPKNSGYLVASGSLPPGVPDDFFAQVAQIARQRGIRFILDTVQPALGRALKSGVFLIKPSLSELCDLTGKELRDEWEQAEAAQKLIRTGQCEVVVLSLGASGAWLATADGAERFWAPSVRVQSAVGAGDSMLGAIVLGLARGMDLKEAVRFGIAAGAAATLHVGTQLCSRDDTERLYGNPVVR